MHHLKTPSGQLKAIYYLSSISLRPEHSFRKAVVRRGDKVNNLNQLHDELRMIKRSRVVGNRVGGGWEELMGGGGGGAGWKQNKQFGSLSSCFLFIIIEK